MSDSLSVCAVGAEVIDPLLDGDTEAATTVLIGYLAAQGSQAIYDIIINQVLGDPDFQTYSANSGVPASVFSLTNSILGQQLSHLVEKTARSLFEALVDVLNEKGVTFLTEPERTEPNYPQLLEFYQLSIGGGNLATLEVRLGLVEEGETSGSIRRPSTILFPILCWPCSTDMEISRVLHHGPQVTAEWSLSMNGSGTGDRNPIGSNCSGCEGRNLVIG